MDNQNKICQNCQQNFIIEPEDFVFYDKIKVPAPTWCPECRMVRRMNWRNERTLYKRKCDAPGHSEDVISVYHKDSSFKVYDQKYWWSDEWDAMDYGRDYDFNKPFFEQFGELLLDVPCVNLTAKNNTNSEYLNFAIDSKNCYLSSGIAKGEETMYSNHVFSPKNAIDLHFVNKVELSYEDVICQNSYRLFYSQYCDDCMDSYFLYDCKNCNNCFGCAGLRNKQYHIFNKPYSKIEYENKMKGIDLGSFKVVEKEKSIFNKFKLNYPRKYINAIKSINVSGDNIVEAKNCKFGFDVLAGGSGSENSKFVFWAGAGMKDVYDGSCCGVNGELEYEVVTSAINISKVFFTAAIWGGHDIYYSYNCHNSCHNLFGCVGLKGKSYCIFNKQYTKEDYEKLVPQIIEHMNNMPYIDKKGRIYKYGEFFPIELSPFSYNETIAQEYFPLTKEEALEKGYNWKEPEKRQLNITITNDQLPDHIKDVKDDIINQIIECGHQGKCNEQCTEAFKIIPQELEFYKKMNLPLPRLCPNCRHYQRLKQRNPLKLWHRKCNCRGAFGISDKGIMNNESGIKYQNTIKHFHGTEPCFNEFETTYAPDRPEIVYCEKCYQQEVV